jgi:hypothetical protein
MEALKSVARNFFAEVELEAADGTSLLAGVVDCCVYIHQSVERKSKAFYEEVRVAHNWTFLVRPGPFLAPSLHL